jgi:hypothetical protein
MPYDHFLAWCEASREKERKQDDFFIALIRKVIFYIILYSGFAKKAVKEEEIIPLSTEIKIKENLPKILKALIK